MDYLKHNKYQAFKSAGPQNGKNWGKPISSLHRARAESDEMRHSFAHLNICGLRGEMPGLRLEMIRIRLKGISIYL